MRGRPGTRNLSFFNLRSNRKDSAHQIKQRGYKMAGLKDVEEKLRKENEELKKEREKIAEEMKYQGQTAQEWSL